MAQLIIKNIGPIKDIDITLNKVNVTKVSHPLKH